MWLTGAGPGDPGLITLRGLECIQQADVLVYDKLSNPALLAHARPGCERVYAGKQAGRHAMPQEEINRLLAEKARAGKKVCRLKGGDPFVFGRGGEEALHLREAGVRYEIVPGVTSAVAVPAYAGIPVTHRKLAASMRVVTGHEDPTKPESDLDWREIAQTGGTLVVLMTVKHLGEIAERLVAFGKNPDTPAALIHQGTLPGQRTATGTLSAIAARADAAGIGPPAILVVGEVAALAGEIAWFEQRPLFGRTILVTRARAQASEFAATLEGLGAEVIQAPTICIESRADTPAMRQCVREAYRADWLVFTSVNGVDAFVEALRLEDLDIRALGAARIAAIGPATAERLRELCLRIDLMPERFVAEALLEALDAQEDLRGQRVVLPRAAIARPALADGLRERGAETIEVAAYDTVREPLDAGVVERLRRGAVDLVTFTSSSTVRNFAEALPADERQPVLHEVRAASIGPITSETLREFGIPIAVEAPESTIPALAAAVAAWRPSQESSDL